MAERTQPRVLIVGAGSMGLLSGYHLQLAGASVTFLVRPHRIEALNRPQILYSYDDNTLKEYTGYTCITSPSSIVDSTYDYILITLDAAALRNDVGTSLVKAIGDAVRKTSTKVVLGTIFPELLPWFLKTAGLGTEQVTNGLLAIFAYPPAAVTLPLHPPTDPELLKKADQAYTEKLGAGLMLDDSAPAVANAFAELWNKSLVSKAIVMPAQALAVMVNPMFVVFAVCALLDWPSPASISTENQLWKLAVEATKEIQGLGIHREAGPAAAQATTPEGLAAQLVGMEQMMLPLDLQGFNKFHHSGKVNVQDREILKACVEFGEAEGKGMGSLRELIRMMEEK